MTEKQTEHVIVLTVPESFDGVGLEIFKGVLDGRIDADITNSASLLTREEAVEKMAMKIAALQYGYPPVLVDTNSPAYLLGRRCAVAAWDALFWKGKP